MAFSNAFTNMFNSANAAKDSSHRRARTKVLEGRQDEQYEYNLSKRKETDADLIQFNEVKTQLDGIEGDASERLNKQLERIRALGADAAYSRNINKINALREDILNDDKTDRAEIHRQTTAAGSKAFKEFDAAIGDDAKGKSLTKNWSKFFPDGDNPVINIDSKAGTITLDGETMNLNDFQQGMVRTMKTPDSLFKSISSKLSTEDAADVKDADRIQGIADETAKEKRAEGVDIRDDMRAAILRLPEEYNKHFKSEFEKGKSPEEIETKTAYIQRRTKDLKLIFDQDTGAGIPVVGQTFEAPDPEDIGRVQPTETPEEEVSVEESEEHVNERITAQKKAEANANTNPDSVPVPKETAGLPPIKVGPTMDQQRIQGNENALNMAKNIGGLPEQIWGGVKEGYSEFQNWVKRGNLDKVLGKVEQSQEIAPSDLEMIRGFTDMRREELEAMGLNENQITKLAQVKLSMTGNMIQPETNMSIVAEQSQSNLPNTYNSGNNTAMDVPGVPPPGTVMN